MSCPPSICPKPTCKWVCKAAPCPQNCTPICEKPKCRIECGRQPLHYVQQNVNLQNVKIFVKKQMDV